LIPHFSPRDFVTVIQRCAKHHVQIIGIEIFDISEWPVQLLEIRNGKHARRLVKAYRNRTGISFAASFDVGDNVPGAKERRERDRQCFEAALGGGPLFPGDECTDKAEK
jgi:hypothetical protein